MAADERNQSSGGFHVLGLLCFWVSLIGAIGLPLTALFVHVLIPGAFDLSALIVEALRP